MGRIKTQLVKRLTKKLLDSFNEQFTENFDQNKKIVKQYISENTSLKMRNVIAGYVTRLKRQGYSKDNFVNRPAAAKISLKEAKRAA